VATTTATTTSNANLLTDTYELMPTIPVQQQTIKPLPKAAAQSDSLDGNHQLDKTILDKFVNYMLPSLMKIRIFIYPKSYPQPKKNIPRNF
jgi:hypothetical protein